MKTIGIWTTCVIMFSSHCASPSEKPKATIPSEISLFVDLAQRRKIHHEYLQASSVFTCDIHQSHSTYPGLVLTRCTCKTPFLSRAVVQDYLLLENIGAQKINKDPRIALLVNVLQEKVQEKMNLSETVPHDFNDKAIYWRKFHTQARSFLAQELEDVVSLKQTDAETMIADSRQMRPIGLLAMAPFQTPRVIVALVVMARLLEHNYRIDTDWFCCTEAGINYKLYLG